MKQDMMRGESNLIEVDRVMSPCSLVGDITHETFIQILTPLKYSSIIRVLLAQNKSHDWRFLYKPRSS
jgi:hypothetical protein